MHHLVPRLCRIHRYGETTLKLKGSKFIDLFFMLLKGQLNHACEVNALFHIYRTYWNHRDHVKGLC